MITIPEINSILKLRDVRKFKVGYDRLLIWTGPIYMAGVYLGKFRIEITTSYEIKIYNETQVVRVKQRNPEETVHHHPHIWADIDMPNDTKMCLGTLSKGWFDLGIFQFVYAHEFTMVMVLLIEFLKNGYGWKEYPQEEFLENWNTN